MFVVAWQPSLCMCVCVSVPVSIQLNPIFRHTNRLRQMQTALLCFVHLITLFSLFLSISFPLPIWLILNTDFSSFPLHSHQYQWKYYYKARNPSQSRGRFQSANRTLAKKPSFFVCVGLLMLCLSNFYKLHSFFILSGRTNTICRLRSQREMGKFEPQREKKKKRKLFLSLFPFAVLFLFTLHV